jgi:hypothetical protein
MQRFWPAAVLGVAAASARAGAQESRVAWTEVQEAMGLGFTARCGSPEKRDIVEANGTGVAVFDADGDGDLDVFFAQGATLEEVNAGGGAHPELFVNGGGAFRKAGESAGLTAARGWWTGVAAADADGDGDVDALVCGYQRTAYFRNESRRGEGAKFVEATKEAHLTDSGWSTGACFFDAEGDGDLDVYLVKYLELDPRNPPRGFVGPLRLPCTWRGHAVYCGPRGFTATPDRFFRNQGTGVFEEATAEAGFSGAPASYGLGVCPVDFDLDGDTDLYVSNDSKANFLFRNDGGTFTECAYLTGAGLGEGGATYAGMGVSEGDVDGSGFPSIVVTNFSDEPVSLYRSRGRGERGGVTFDFDSPASGLSAKTMSTLKWGVDMADFDLDGDLDLFVCNGHVYPQADAPNTGTSYAQRNQLFWNDGKGRWAEAAWAGGSPMLVKRSHRALALLDLDDDGDLDALVVPVDGAAILLRNGLATAGAGGPARVRVEVRGAGKNTEALGALVTVVCQGKRLVRQVRRSGSYASSRDPRLCFGLGAAKAVDKIEIRWPGGSLTEVPGEGLVNCAVVVGPPGLVSKKPLAGAEPVK